VLPLAHPGAWRAASAALLAALVIACLVPMGPVLGPESGNLDKVGHFVAYLVLAGWFAGLYPRPRYGRIALALALLGLAIEVLQQLMGLGREGDPLDLMANLAGIGVGFALGHGSAGGWGPRVEAWLARR
jgi:VanZ family protein